MSDIEIKEVWAYVPTSFANMDAVYHIPRLDVVKLAEDYASNDAVEMAGYWLGEIKGGHKSVKVLDNTSLNALRVLHVDGVIKLRVVFTGDNPVGQEVTVYDTGKFSEWPKSVLDLGLPSTFRLTKRVKVK